VADAHRREWAAVLAATVRVARHLDVAEECVQDAYVAALDAWARSGVPANPGAWLTVTARRNVLDALRRAATLRTKLPLLAEAEAVEMAYPDEHAVPDDRLRLIFMCCHPALSEPARVALTLRLVCGLGADDIAAVFLVPETTMLARITRAKKKIAAAHIPFGVPERADLPDRLDAVLAVLHLLFTAGHTAPSGPSLTRADLAQRAVDLAAVLHDLMPAEREVHGLLALLVVNHARRATRTDGTGRLLLLEEQDRSRWDRRAIAAAHRHVVVAMRGGRPGRYALQAAIATLHATAPTYADTDWPQVLQLYDELRAVWPSPVVALNRVVAVAMVHGPDAALGDVGDLERGGELDAYHYLPAVKAELLRRLGRDREAAACYRRALELADNEAERAFLARRRDETAAPGP
jgi:RNA polymerase sigma-70 factor (ECF subfamily)